MNEGRVTMKGLVESRRMFREAGASEEQLARFGDLSDFARVMCVGMIRRGAFGDLEEALSFAEGMNRKAS